MTIGIAINRTDLDAAGLRRAAARSRDADAARRMLALALIMDGHTRTEAAQLCGMDRQTLRDWVHRYNDLGLAGLSDRVAPGPKTSAFAGAGGRGGAAGSRGADICRTRRGALAPDRPVSGDRATVWRASGRAERGYAAASFGLSPSFRPATPSRSRHGGPGGAQKNFADLVAAAIPEHAHGKQIELWWQDEARIGQQGTLTRLWAERGSRPSAPRDCRYDWAYIFGAVCPARGVGASLVLPYANTEAMNLHLIEISSRVAPDAHAVITMDGAGWHRQGRRLQVPHNISILLLPPYSPELNPQENVWQYLRQNYLANRVFDTYEATVDACCDAWNKLTNQPATITSIATRQWALQVKL